MHTKQGVQGGPKCEVARYKVGRARMGQPSGSLMAEQRQYRGRLQKQNKVRMVSTVAGLAETACKSDGGRTTVFCRGGPNLCSAHSKLRFEVAQGSPPPVQQQLSEQTRCRSVVKVGPDERNLKHITCIRTRYRRELNQADVLQTGHQKRGSDKSS